VETEWRKGKDDKDSDNDKEVSLVATTKKEGKAAGNKKGNNPSVNTQHAITVQRKDMWKQTVGRNTQTRLPT
jgi:hypothetical protein